MRDTLDRPFVAFALLLALALVPLCVFHGRAVDLNEHLTRVRYAYRARAPGALGGTGFLRTVHHGSAGLSSQLAADPRAPADSSLYALGICTPRNSNLPLPLHVGLRIRGELPGPLGLYFTGAGSGESLLRLDPDGELPDRVESSSAHAPSSATIQPPADFASTHARAGRGAGELYHDISVLFTPGSIVATSDAGSRTIPAHGAADITSICVAPVVSGALSVLDQVTVKSSPGGRSPSFAAADGYSLRPLLHPFDLETWLADDGLFYLVASLVFLALISVLCRGLIRVVLGGRPDRAIRPHSLAGLLTLPGQILVLSFARAAFGLALLPFHVVAVALILHELLELRHYSGPVRRAARERSLRPAFVGVCAVAFLGYLAHAAGYRAGSSPDLSVAWAAVAASLPLLLLWRYGLDRRVPLRAMAAVLAQCALFFPLRVVQPALTPITFYALAAIPLVVALVVLGAASPAPRRPSERVFRVFAVVVVLLLAEVAIRGDHHLAQTTSPAALGTGWYNNHVRRILEADLGRGRASGALPETVELAAGPVRVAKDRGQLRVVCLGSSSTYGVGASSIDDGYPARLESILAAPAGRAVEVINGGVPGAMLSFLDLYLERVLLPLDPDLVVLYFGANGDSELGARDIARLGRWLDDCATTPTPTQVWAATQLRWPRPWLVRGMARATDIRGLVWIVNAAQNLRRAGGGGPTGVATAADHGSAIERARHESGSAWSIAQRCRASHTPLLLVPEIMREENDRVCSADATQCMHPYRAVFRYLAELSEDDPVHHADLMPAFPPAARQELMLDGVHMRPAGYELLAGSIADVIEEAGWLEGGRPE